MNVPRVVIAGTHSGAGKTTVALGLMAAFRRAGLRVQPFKVGPDYIDPGLHAAAAGRPSRNLDSWMLPEGTLLSLFRRAAAGAEVAVIEGVMGLYDGYSGRGDAGSTAHVAKLLGAPVILVVDASGAVRSVAATVLGFRELDREVRLAGVICNLAGGPRHREWLREAVEEVGVPFLGALPRVEGGSIPERHLGLVPASERQYREVLDRLALAVREYVEWERVLAVARQAPPLPSGGGPEMPLRTPRVRIGVARDRAFSFYYEDALDVLRASGAELFFFSPLEDGDLPDGVSGLYLGGGFPEVYAAELEANRPMREAIRTAAEAGMPVYAECGGLMYLCRRLRTSEGRSYEMAGVFPYETVMGRRVRAIGYVEVEAERPTCLLARGERARGHEFHWSSLPAGVAETAYRMVEGFGLDGRRDGLVHRNVLASYVHLHLAAVPHAARRFVDACEAFALWR